MALRRAGRQSLLRRRSRPVHRRHIQLAARGQLRRRDVGQVAQSLHVRSPVFGDWRARRDRAQRDPVAFGEAPSPLLPQQDHRLRLVLLEHPGFQGALVHRRPVLHDDRGEIVGIVHLNGGGWINLGNSCQICVSHVKRLQGYSYSTKIVIYTQISHATPVEQSLSNAPVEIFLKFVLTYIVVAAEPLVLTRTEYVTDPVVFGESTQFTIIF